LKYLTFRAKNAVLQTVEYILDKVFAVIQPKLHVNIEKITFDAQNQNSKVQIF
jgi:tellurite resistance-related uncharacterized protein